MTVLTSFTIFPHLPKKNSSNGWTMLFLNITLPWFDEFFSNHMLFSNNSKIRQKYHCATAAWLDWKIPNIYFCFQCNANSFIIFLLKISGHLPTYFISKQNISLNKYCMSFFALSCILPFRSLHKQEFEINFAFWHLGRFTNKNWKIFFYGIGTRYISIFKLCSRWDFFLFKIHVPRFC